MRWKSRRIRIRSFRCLLDLFFWIQIPERGWEKKTSNQFDNVRREMWCANWNVSFPKPTKTTCDVKKERPPVHWFKNPSPGGWTENNSRSESKEWQWTIISDKINHSRIYQKQMSKNWTRRLPEKRTNVSSSRTEKVIDLLQTREKTRRTAEHGCTSGSWRRWLKDEDDDVSLLQNSKEFIYWAERKRRRRSLWKVTRLARIWSLKRLY